MNQHSEPAAARERGLRWGVERRMEFIDFRLCWEGGINRGDLMRQFGVSVQQASADMARYQELAPANLIYDRNVKRYLASPDYRPVFRVDDSDRYLAHLRSLGEKLIQPDEAWMSEVPSFQILPIPSRPIAPAILKAVMKAIRKSSAIEVLYQSMSRPAPLRRWISPHALGFDGLRWHIRAWCHIDHFFKDFVFARIHEVGASQTSEVDPEKDRAWFETVPVAIATHPDLSKAQRKTIALDYGMDDGLRVIQVRRAFLFYFLRQLRLDGGASGRDPAEQQIVLANQTEIRDVLEKDRHAKAATTH
ncbi:MAG: WYL domain-containing protein [Rhodospirillales bacterium]|nr:WYL domain-containing protein [Rhodospirillales bacterium]